MIIYPAKLIKQKVRVNAYGRKAWGDVAYYKSTKNGYRIIGSMDYVRGYRDAVKEIRNLNKTPPAPALK